MEKTQSFGGILEQATFLDELCVVSLNGINIKFLNENVSESLGSLNLDICFCSLTFYVSVITCLLQGTQHSKVM